MKTMVFDRARNQLYEEDQYGRKQLLFLYGTVLGRVLLGLFVSPAFSKINAIYNNSRFSVKKIEPFIEKYHIDREAFEEKEYRSFNDFFVRKQKQGRLDNMEKSQFIAVADSKLLVFPIGSLMQVKIKNIKYTLPNILRSKKLANQYKDGLLFVFRLTVDDCHRYCFPDDGERIAVKKIRGFLHTVSAAATKKYPVYCENSREIAVLRTDHFGLVTQIEVGAMLVGKIVNKARVQFQKGEEKGYFEMGGSTILVLVQKGVLQVDRDILEYSERGIETRVKMGEQVALLAEGYHRS